MGVLITDFMFLIRFFLEGYVSMRKLEEADMDASFGTAFKVKKRTIISFIINKIKKIYVNCGEYARGRIV